MVNEHEWISLPNSHGADIVHCWCPKCGTVRLEAVGELDPYEYFIVGKPPVKEGYWYVGERDAPGCK